MCRIENVLASLPVKPPECLKHVCELPLYVCILLAVERGEKIVIWLDVKLLENVIFACCLCRFAKRIDNGIACHRNFAMMYTLSYHVSCSAVRRREKVVGKMISQYPVDLFRHRLVVAAQSGLDMPEHYPYVCERFRRG